MKTIQEHLREADREEILGSLSYDLLCNPMALLEMKERTVREIQDAYKQKMNQLIDDLLTLKPDQSDHMVFYLCDSKMDECGFCHTDHSLALVDTNEISKDLDASSYGVVITAWEESLGYLVAENKLTQDNLQELLVLYVKEITFFGLDPEQHGQQIEQVKLDLERSREEIERGKYYTFEEVFEQIWEEQGLPIDEKDEEQDRLRRKIQEAEYQYGQYCHRRERRRILESLDIEPPEEGQILSQDDKDPYTVHFCKIPGECMSRVWIGPDPEKNIEFTGSYVGVAYDQWFEEYGKVVREDIMKWFPEVGRGLYFNKMIEAGYSEEEAEEILQYLSQTTCNLLSDTLDQMIRMWKNDHTLLSD